MYCTAIADCTERLTLAAKNVERTEPLEAPALLPAALPLPLIVLPVVGHLDPLAPCVHTGVVGKLALLWGGSSTSSAAGRGGSRGQDVRGSDFWARSQRCVAMDAAAR